MKARQTVLNAVLKNLKYQRVLYKNVISRLSRMESNIKLIRYENQVSKKMTCDKEPKSDIIEKYASVPAVIIAIGLAFIVCMIGYDLYMEVVMRYRK